MFVCLSVSPGALSAMTQTFKGKQNISCTLACACFVETAWHARKLSM